jgi:hypothetical protein
MPFDPPVPGEAMDDLLRDEQQARRLDLDRWLSSSTLAFATLQVQHLQQPSCRWAAISRL